VPYASTFSRFSYFYLYQQSCSDQQQQNQFRITVEVQAKNISPSLCFSLCEKQNCKAHSRVVLARKRLCVLLFVFPEGTKAGYRQARSSAIRKFSPAFFKRRRVEGGASRFCRGFSGKAGRRARADKPDVHRLRTRGEAGAGRAAAHRRAVRRQKFLDQKFKNSIDKTDNICYNIQRTKNIGRQRKREQL